MKKIDLEVGSIVYLKPTRANKGCEQDYVEYEVKRLGDIHIEVWMDKDERTKLMFHRQTLRQITSAPTMWKLYLEVQEIYDEAEAKEIVSMLKKKLNGKANLSLHQLRQIRKIIE